MRFLAALFGLLLITGSAQAASSINTAQPLQGIPYNASPVRLNFGAAANDINALQTLNAGASAPSNPSLGYLWVQTGSASKLYPLSVWDGVKWLPIGTVDAATHLWTPPVGGGAAGSLLSAATTDLGSVAASSVTVTGNNPIFSFGASAPPGTIKFVTFSGSPTLNYNATSLLLPTKANISVSAGDTVIAQALGAGSWNVLVYQPVSGFPINIFTTGQVQNTTALRNACTGAIGCPLGDFVFPNGVIRWTDGVAGAPPLPYSKDTAGICSADDGGHCVAAAGGGYWLAQFSGPADVREWGAVNNAGVTDDTAAINAAFLYSASSGTPIWFPSSPTGGGFGVNAAGGVLIPAGASERGVLFPSNPPSGSTILCANTVTPCLTVSGNSTTSGLGNNNASLDGLLVSRVGTAPANSQGILQIGGYAVHFHNVMSINSYDGITANAVCTSPPSTGCTWGIHAEYNNVYIANVSHCYLTSNNWPELYYIGGRMGMNGSGDTYASTAYVCITGGAGGGGEGPNTLRFIGTQFNASGSCPQNFMDFFNITGAGVNVASFGVEDGHIECVANGGALFASDASTTNISRLQLSQNVFNTPGASVWNLNSATALSQLNVEGNQIYCNDFTLSPNPGSGAGFIGVDISNNFISCASHITANVSGNTLSLDSNHYKGNMTIDGAVDWGALSVNGGDFVSGSGVYSGTTSGHLIWNIANAPLPCTMTLATGGANIPSGDFAKSACSWYAVGGNINVTYQYTLNSVAGITAGSLTFSGMPIIAGVATQGGSVPFVTGMTGLTGAPSVNPQGANTSANWEQFGATGTSDITAANLTSTTSVGGVFIYKR